MEVLCGENLSPGNEEESSLTVSKRREMNDDSSVGLPNCSGRRTDDIVDEPLESNSIQQLLEMSMSGNLLSL